MAAGFRPILVSLTVVMLATLFVILACVQFLQLKNPTSDILSSQYGLNSTVTTLNSGFNNISILSNKTKNDLGGADVDKTNYLFLIFRGAFEIPKTIFGTLVIILSLFGTIFLGGLLKNAGLDSAIITALNVMFSIITITIVVITIKFIRSGDPEGR